MKTFYEYQEAARANSAVLMGILSLAILVTTLATGLALTLWLFVPTFYLIHYFVPHPVGDHEVFYPDWVPNSLLERMPELRHFPWELCGFFFIVLTAATGAAIVIVTRNKVRELWTAGGIGVAESLGGICVTAEGYRRDDKIQRAVNVVNEVAIATRLPAPQVYLLHDEPGINAFAVGLTDRDMVLGLTAGCVQHLNREQLQGVVGHEFAHIANGDTVRNILLVGYLHGLMALIISAQSMIQKGIEFLVKSISYGGQGIVGMFITVCGVFLWPVGLIGLGCATAVKAAYSRQREFLADASALEFVRNDRGIGDAMKRIMAHKAGSRVLSPRCLALSHVFFAKSAHGVLGFFDSHPPLEKRILRVDSDWDGEVQFEDEHEVGEFGGVFNGTMSIAQQARPSGCGRLDGVDAFSDTSTPLKVSDELSMLVNQHALGVRGMLPDALWSLTQDLPTAEAMVFALWAVGQSSSPEDDAKLCALGKTCDAAKQVADALKPHLDCYGLPERLMLFDAAINVIRQNSQQSDLTDFCRKAHSLLEQPTGGDLFRWSWKKSLQLIVDRETEAQRPQPRFGECLEVLDDCQVLISALAQANDSDVMRSYSLQRASNILQHDIELLPPTECTLEAIDRALERLQLLAPKARRQLVLAGSTSVETDSKLNETESLLMRGICSGLGYPPATILPGQPVKLT